MFIRSASIFLSLLCLAGCGGTSDGMLIPIGEVATPGRRIDMLVATIRSSDGAQPGQMFTGERNGELAFADIAVSVPPDSVRQIGEVQWPKTAPGNPATDFVTLKTDRINAQEAMARFHKRVAATPKRRALVFVHGYNTRFEDAVYRFAQIVHDSEAPVTGVLYTWPSRGKLLAYTYDRESANYSRDALEKILQAMAKDPSVGEIAILAHSMGNWVTLEALRQMVIRDKTLPRKLQNVMLAAPDVDIDVFRQQLASIDAATYKPPITMFVSQDDKALAVSNKLWGGTARAGAVDPKLEPYKTQFAKAHLNVIDLTDVHDGGRSGHGKFAESPEVVQMIGRRLASGQSLGENRSGLGDQISGVAMGAAGIVGSAAGFVASAPIAIVDKSTRDSLGDRMEEMSNGASDLVRLPTSNPRARKAEHAHEAE